jgi:hypothetical protein
MDGLRALRLVAHDLWEESSLLLLVGLAGGVLSLLILPIPFVLAAHYATAARISEDRVATFRTWLEEGWANARFFYGWVLLFLLLGVPLLSGILFYSRLAAPWSIMLRWLCILFLTIWLLPQPLVAALYWQQEDRRLRTALRNAFVITASDPLSVLVLWIVSLVVGGVIAYYVWPLLLLLPLLAAVFSTNVLKLKLPSTFPE